MALRFNIVRINRDALSHNLARVRQLIGPHVKIMAVVKADAYGHGLVPAARTFTESGADALGVMDVHEAATLRDNGFELPVFVLAGIEPDQCDEFIARNVTPFIYDIGLAREMDAAAKKAGKTARIHLKIDTGMGRLGASIEEAALFLEKAAALEHLRIDGLCTHFPDADDEDTAFTTKQISGMEKVIDLATALGYDLFFNSAANSAAVLSHPAAHFQMVRPGLMLYGASPAPHLEKRAGLLPAMSFAGRIAQVKIIKSGDTVSYGRTWRAERETTAAVVPVGYAHGYNRLFSNRGAALIRGRRAPLIGRVCMNLTIFDVTGIEGAAPGDEVVLLGSQGGETITADELAGWRDTINYEVLCNLGGVNQRMYK